MHRYRRRYLLVELSGNEDKMQSIIQGSPVRVKLIKANNKGLILRCDAGSMDSLKRFVIGQGMKTLKVSGTIDGLSRHRRRDAKSLNYPYAKIASG